MRQPEQNNQDRARRQDRQNRTASTPLSDQYCQDRMFRAIQQDRIGGTGQPEKESLNRTA